MNTRPARFLRGCAVLAVLTAAFLLTVGVPAASAAPGEYITTYHTGIEVRADGLMRVTEAIAYDFGPNSRHGIVRRIPTRFHYDGTHDRVYPIEDVTATMDGAPVRVDRSSDGGYQRFRIGDPDRTVTGLRTYVIRYSVRGAINGFADHEELYWNLVGTEWDVPITTATATVTGPAGVQQIRCYTGPAGYRLDCLTAAADGATASFKQFGLVSGWGMTAVIGYPAGSIANTGPILVARDDWVAAFHATPVTVGGGIGLALAGVAGVVVIAWVVGRDRRYLGQLPGLVPGPGEPAVERRRPLTGAPPVSVEFVPPDNLRPGQVGALIDEKADVVDVTATIVDLAVRKHLHIRELPRSRRPDWLLTKIAGDDGSFLAYERVLFNALFRGRDQVRLSELKHTFADDLEKARACLYTDMVSQGWYRRSPERTRRRARGLALAVLLASVGLTALLGRLFQAALIGVGLVVGALVLFVAAGRFPARTGRGSAALARVQGFRLYVATAEAEKIRFEEREQIFSRYLPYAMVFGLAERWAAAFAQLAAVRPDGTSGLYWYTGGAGWNLGAFGQSIGSFASTTAGTIGAAPPSASGSSGLSGGFSGGGGGGGGGGSW